MTIAELNRIVENGNDGKLKRVKDLKIWKQADVAVEHKSNDIAVIYPLKSNDIRSNKSRGWDVKLVTNKPDMSIRNWQLQRVYVDPQSLKRYSIESLKVAEAQDEPIVVLKWIMILGQELPTKEEPE